MSKLPGNLDTLHTHTLYPAQNRYGIPNLLSQPNPITPPFDLLPYRYGEKLRTDRPVLIHFHTDDRRFESIWHEPSRGLRSGQRDNIWAMCSPDFSLWAGYPLALQIFNTYRNRWLGRYFQENGICVIPTVNWSTPASYAFAFLGIPQYQVVTLRTYQLQGEERENFLGGYRAMVEALAPSAILWFGIEYPELHDDGVIKHLYPVGFGKEEW